MGLFRSYVALFTSVSLWQVFNQGPLLIKEYLMSVIAIFTQVMNLKTFSCEDLQVKRRLLIMQYY